MTGDGAMDIVDLGTISADEVRHSVARNLEYLLNTRTDSRAQQNSFSVVNYGIPDFSALSAGDVVQVRQLSLTIQQAVTAFEPRLNGVRVDIIKTDATDLEQSIRIQLSAMLRVEPIKEDVKFFLVIQNKYGKVNVYEGE